MTVKLFNISPDTEHCHGADFVHTINNQGWDTQADTQNQPQT